MSKEYVDIFVYGTLQRGLPLHGYLAGAEFLGRAMTTPDYTLTECGIPFMYQNGRTAIRGEVYRVPVGPMLHALDRVEGAYTRTLIELAHGPVATAQAYIMEGSPDLSSAWETMLPGGDYRVAYDADLIR
jgi:gamma-glutamylcyclotransferase (GGCT)/AIG2-like uncharacterized protein YtfP